MISRLIVLFAAAMFCLQANVIAQENTEKEEMKTEMSESKFDQELAEKYAADDYGMGQYVMAFLRSGPNRDRSPEEAQKLQAAHMANIGRLAEEGKLLVAGPFLDGGELRGIYIFDVKTVEEAAELTATDPAIQAGSLVMELHPWYGSAAMRAVNEIHGKISKKDH